MICAPPPSRPPLCSIWTVDLAHLLKSFGLDVCFFTITLGPNPAYANERFYMAHMREDEVRVARLFGEAPGAGISIQQRSLSSQDLQAMLLTGDYLVIALVDKSKLDPWLVAAAADAAAAAADTAARAAAAAAAPALCGGELGYVGHYVLVIGVDPARGEFIIRDPARLAPEHRVSAGAFDTARRTFGTDEDLLLVRLTLECLASVGAGARWMAE